MNLEIKIIERETTPVLSIKTRTPVEKLPEAIGKGYGDIINYMGSLNEYPSSAPFVGYFNMDMSDLDVEIGFPTNGKLEGKSPIVSSEIPKGSYVTCRHIGSYETFEGTYTAIMHWMEEQKVEMAGPSYEIYQNSPEEVKPEELITDIYILLK